MSTSQIPRLYTVHLSSFFSVFFILLFFVYQEPNATPMYLSPGKKHEAVRCLEAHPRTRRVYSSCGSKIVVLSVRKGIALEKIVETRKEG